MGLKTILGIILLSTLVLACAAQPNQVGTVDLNGKGIHRTVDLQGDILTVTLHVVLPNGARFYLFEENLPVNAEFVKADVDRAGDSLKHVVFSNAVDTTYSYQLKVNQGSTIMLKGVYALDGMEKELPIDGISQVST